jgi:radical SAM superfamily enzyme YgiQ (UPF0313 family)
MKILLIYPEFPDTFWSFKHAVKFIFKKASNPPLGLLTVAALLPDEWEKRLVDMNVRSLRDEDIRWADYVFVSAMAIQKASVKTVIGRCNALEIPVVAGGPLFTTDYNDYPTVDYLVLNEAEITLPLFIDDVKNGTPRRIYQSDKWADIKSTPIPMWDLVNMKNYASITIQYSRGCPFNCEFCDITLLCGQAPRTKDTAQILAELESIYERGWRDGVFFVDDNFIGNKKKLKCDVLPAIAQWQDDRRHPYVFITQASIELADDDELRDKMVNAGFDTVFVGIETPNEESLVECNKFQNKGRDLLASVKTIQRSGLQVQGGFIVGFDNDPLSIFESQIKFIQNSGIVTAMVGLLNALPRTKLYNRLEKEQRLIKDTTGDNTDVSINFIPKMNYDILISGYKNIISTVYSPRHYYKRVKTFLREYMPKRKSFRFRRHELGALLRSMVVLGVVGKERFHYWKLFFWTMVRRPRLFPMAITLAIYGFHFRKVFEKNI